MLAEDVSWVERYAAELAPAATHRRVVRWVQTPSGAAIAHVGGVGGVVAKVHAGRMGADDVQRRLALVADRGGQGLRATVFVQPVTTGVARTPVEGRAVTVWPAVTVLRPGAHEPPWAEAGRLLARLHLQQAPVDSPAHGGQDRLVRAVDRLHDLPCDIGDGDDGVRAGPAGGHLLRLGTRLEHEVREVTARAERQTSEGAVRPGHSLVHGDFHLGQLALMHERLRLLDVDDVGAGDPAWDLARPAGFWAAGLLEDAAWLAFLEGYRAAGGPAVPPTGDPWSTLELPARCAVFVATVRLSVQAEQEGLDADRLSELAALSAACHRM